MSFPPPLSSRTPFREGIAISTIYIFPHVFIAGSIQMLFRSLGNLFIVAAKCRKRAENFCTIRHRHSRVLHQEIPVIPRIRQVDDVFVIVNHALCPPICWLRSRVVAPSCISIPLKMAFLPKRFLMAICACIIFFSRSIFFTSVKRS